MPVIETCWPCAKRYQNSSNSMFFRQKRGTLCFIRIRLIFKHIGYKNTKRNYNCKNVHKIYIIITRAITFAPGLTVIQLRLVTKFTNSLCRKIIMRNWSALFREARGFFEKAWYAKERHDANVIDQLVYCKTQAWSIFIKPVSDMYKPHCCSFHRGPATIAPRLTNAVNNVIPKHCCEAMGERKTHCLSIIHKRCASLLIPCMFW